jgi:hypothetical protein
VSISEIIALSDIMTLEDAELESRGKHLPVLIIAYARPALTRQLLESLKSCGIEKVYISLDGPKNNSIKQLQDEIRSTVAELESDNFKIIVRQNEANLGVALGVIRALDWFFSQCREGIILEDDLVISKKFIEFCDWGLQEIKNFPKCLLVSGYVLSPFVTQNNEAFFCNYPMIWGWATNSERWLLIRELIIRKKVFEFRIIFNRRLQFWYVGAARANLGFVDTWDTQLAYEFVNEFYYCLLPKTALVNNVGFDSSATHTKKPPRIAIQELTDYLYTIPAKHIHPEALIYPGKYEELFEKEIYRISCRNYFSIYKFWIEKIFKNDFRESLRDRISWS